MGRPQRPPHAQQLLDRIRLSDNLTVWSQGRRRRRGKDVLNTIPRQKIRDVVVERLKSYITSGGLKPGDRLPNESELAATFGVSRLSLREAT
ncbi:FadR/GntR family transcriptional regulator, partial [Singulisphaera rosea]